MCERASESTVSLSIYLRKGRVSSLQSLQILSCKTEVWTNSGTNRVFLTSYGQVQHRAALHSFLMSMETRDRFVTCSSSPIRAQAVAPEREQFWWKRGITILLILPQCASIIYTHRADIFNCCLLKKQTCYKYYSFFEQLLQ